MKRPRWIERVRTAWRDYSKLNATLRRELLNAQQDCEEFHQALQRAHERNRHLTSERDMYYARWQAEQRELGTALKEIASLRTRIGGRATRASRQAMRGVAVVNGATP